MSDYGGLGKGSARVSQGASRQVPEPIVSTAKKGRYPYGLRNVSHNYSNIFNPAF